MLLGTSTADPDTERPRKALGRCADASCQNGLTQSEEVAKLELQGSACSRVMTNPYLLHSGQLQAGIPS